MRKAKLIGTSGFTDPEKIQSVYLQEWNSIFLQEYEKYSFQDKLKLKEENYMMSISNMILLNEQFSVVENLTNEMSYKLEETDLVGMVYDYKCEIEEGIGVAYIVESFNKINETGNFYVVFFDLKTKAIIFHKKLSTKPGGFGIKSFWVRCFWNAQNEYFPGWYKTWKKEFK